MPTVPQREARLPGSDDSRNRERDSRRRLAVKAAPSGGREARAAGPAFTASRRRLECRSDELMTWGATGPWTLTVEGWDILTVIFAYQLDIIAYGGDEGDCTIRLAGAFELRDPDGKTYELDAAQQPWEELTPVLSLRHDTLSSLVAPKMRACLSASAAGGRSARRPMRRRMSTGKSQRPRAN